VSVSHETFDAQTASEVTRGGSAARRNGRNTSSPEILEAATVVFSEHGYRGSNLNHVAAKLGVTRQAIYYYYPTKHAILLALFQRFFDQLEEAAASVRSADPDPATLFEMLLRTHIRCVAQRPELSSIFTKEYGSLEPDARQHIRERRRAYHETFVSAYEAGRKSGQLRDLPVQPAVSLILGAANWIFRWYRGTPSIDELTDVAIALFRDGYCAPHDRASPSSEGAQ
jgi:AcrR family transcriptional regulator